MRAKEHLNLQPPETLYHYTTQRGLLGIIGSKEVWASHTQYLNDFLEFRYAVSIVKEELSGMKSETNGAEKAAKLEEMEKALIEGIESINVCVCSFSAGGDVLSQWRAYGGGNSGFSIGFSGAYLRSVCESLGFWLAPVVYEQEKQRELVRTLLEDVLLENLQDIQPNVEQPLGGNLIAYLYRYAPLLKHGSFAEEREWRIISRPLMFMDARFGHREGASMLIPYFRIPLESDGKPPLGIERIIVGPTPHPEQSKRSVRGLLRKHGLRSETHVSQVPYRNW